MARKLVTVREIAEIRPIPGADAIECAVVDGWTVVVKKGEFSAGHHGVFFEIDSFLPITDTRYGFLKDIRTDATGRQGYRLRTIKLRGQLSQGLLLPLADFHEINAICEGDGDFADLLGVVLWEPKLPACLSGVARGNFPSFIRKTDQDRVQNVHRFVDPVYGWEVTQKLDGSSMTVYWRDGAFGVCSRNLDLEETEGNSFWSVANRYKLRDAMNELGMNIALQGELIGEGIQGNPEKISGQDFYLFDIWLIDDEGHAIPAYRMHVLTMLNMLLDEPIKHAPVLHSRYVFATDAICDEALALADMQSVLSDSPAEGIVFKRLNGAFSMKAISNRYLLKEAS